MTEPAMTPEDARRVLTEWRDMMDNKNREDLDDGWDVPPDLYRKVEALDYALSQAWVPKEVAQAVLPLVVDEVEGAKWCDENNPHFGKSNTAKWQALVDALAEE